MNAPCPAPLASLVVKWPRALAGTDIVQNVARRLGEARIAATWSLEEPGQAAALASMGVLRRGGDVALVVADAVLTLEGVASPKWTDEIGGRLEEIRAEGIVADTLHTGLDMARSSCQRTLRVMGIRAIVTEAASAAASAARPLPFGIWQLAPRLAVPAVRRWMTWFRNRRRLTTEGDQAPTALAILDLARLASTGVRGGREFEALVAELVDLRARGAASVACVGEVAEHLSEVNAPRPQRSILRAA